MKTLPPKSSTPTGEQHISPLSVDTEEGTISGEPMSKGLDADSSPTNHTADEVTVSANSFVSIFNVAEAVDVIGGTVSGLQPSKLRVTWGDGTTTTLLPKLQRAHDGADNRFSVIIVPSMENVTRLEFENSIGSSEVYGFGVITV